MDVLVVELSAINLTAQNGTAGAVKLAAEYKVNIKFCTEQIMAM